MRTRGQRRSTSLFSLSPIVAALASALAPQGAGAVTYVVNQFGDAAGACTATCTLRQAIQSANANCGSDAAPLITFNIPGTGPFVISAASSLALACSTQAMHATIDATTQPGYQPTTDPNGFNVAGIQIVVDGSGFYGGNLLTVDNFPYGSSLTVMGMELRNHATGTALNGNVRLRGSYLHGNAFGLDPFGFGPSNRAEVGSAGLANRNLFRNNSTTAIDISNGGYVDIFNNLVGLDPTGATPAPNGNEGIVLENAFDVTIQQNYIAGNNSSGIRVTTSTSAPHVAISQNKIGLTPAGGTAPNSTGVKVDSSVAFVVGNEIAGNADNGVRVYETSGASTALISANGIHSNGLKNIDLDFAGGPLPNDLNDTDTGPNNRQNHPVVTSVTQAGGNTSVSWSLSSEAGQTYVVEFFSNPSAGVPAGTVYLAQSANMVADGSGTVSGLEVISGLHTNIAVTATNVATSQTSEFSPAVAATAAPAVSVAPNPLNFPSTIVASSSGPTPITVTSTGSLPYVISQFDSAPTCYGGPICAAGSFNCSNTCTTGTPYATSASCSINVTFTPSATGPHSTTFYICDNAPGSPRAVTLSGIGITAPPPTITPASHDFGNLEVGGTSATQAFTVTNPSTGSITLSAFGVTGPYQIASTTCGATLAASATCAVNARFVPAAAGPASGVLSATASTGPVSASLAGNGTPSPSPTLTPSSLDFGSVQLGGQSGAGTFTLTNPALLPLTLSTFTVAAPFSLISTTCPTSLAPSASCTADVRFAPSAAGPASGALTNVTGRGTLSSGLTGSGTASPPSTIAPVNHDFGPIAVGTTSGTKAFTITNPALLPVTLSAFTVTAPFNLVSTTCTTSLPAGASCAANVSFSPTVSGLASGSIGNTTGNGPVSASLAGTGAQPALLVISPATFDFGAVPLGSSSPPRPFLVKNPGLITVATQAPTVTGPFQLVSTTCGSQLAANTSCDANVRFVPAAAGSAMGTLVATSSAGSTSAALSGQGAREPGIEIPTETIDFGSITLGEPGVSHTVRLTSSGNDILGIFGIQVGAPFRLVNRCGVSIAPGDSCTFTIEFDPVELGDFNTNVVVNTNAPNASSIQIRVRAQVQARPEPRVRASPGAIAFGNQVGGSSSPARTITLTNEGGVAATLGLALNSPQFVVVGTNCGATLAPQRSCTAQVAFQPQGYGPRSGQYVITSNSPNSPIRVDLSGAGCRGALGIMGRGTPSIACAP